MEPKGTIAFTTVGRPNYGFDIFSVNLPSTIINDDLTELTERRLTDGTSINFNGQFLDEEETLVYVSERTGSARIFLNRPGNPEPELLPTVSESLFHDRPTVNNGRLIFISTHEDPNENFKSWSAVYETQIDCQKTVRLTPYGAVDFSPSISESGKFVAVASYGFRSWKGDFNELDTDIVVFQETDPTQRKIVCKRGGWPTWSGDSTIFFHRKADDGWWSIFQIDLQEKFEFSDARRITPSGVHAFTPCASHNGRFIAVATRRRGNDFRHIELFDLESKSFLKVTELLNPSFHHYNPFFSPKSGFLGYHRFRGESAPGDSTIPYIEVMNSPLKQLRMLRISGNFPAFTADGDYIAMNPDFLGLQIIKSDGLKKWTVIADGTFFYNSWSRTEKGVIYTSIGPIFASTKATVQIARISFDPTHLDDRDEISAEIKILTTEESGNNAFPSCSPDGKHVVFRSGRSGSKNLYIVDAINGEVNGEIRQLTEGPWIDTMPNWSPNGELIAFSSNRHNPEDVECFSIYLIRPDGTDLRRVHVAGPEGSDGVNRERINHVCFSPDCEWLLFTANLGSVSSEPVSLPNQFQPYGDLYISRLDGSRLQRLTWNGYENGTPAWHVGADVDLGSLSLETKKVGDKLKGQFQEPLWISCDI
ncbi:tolB protein-like protein [Thalictrum thalictroides]|uniref:TolB protein-like protein n=1 Tax=Thalictrum thalictroides TaxID=46969 RepID=A0A7J6XC37_THATH|nr:tolB protein-like protein [Thalictrum thalictroides]